MIAPRNVRHIHFIACLDPFKYPVFRKLQYQGVVKGLDTGSRNEFICSEEALYSQPCMLKHRAIFFLVLVIYGEPAQRLEVFEVVNTLRSNLAFDHHIEPTIIAGHRRDAGHPR